ncbi:MAG: histidine kinase [Bryobacterales bacterium]|nr:histidine kinase [Bryobacterales bacterium]
MTTQTAAGRATSPDCLAGGGEMGALMRSIAWSQTPIGAVEWWSPTLRTMVSYLLANRVPMLLWWGPSFCQLYNDAFLPYLGAKHPKSMGQPAGECWAENWHFIGPPIENAFRSGAATWTEDMFLEVQRPWFAEEARWRIGYRPVMDETAPNRIGGVAATVDEITEKIISERRIVLLRDLGSRSTGATTAEQAFHRPVTNLTELTEQLAAGRQSLERSLEALRESEARWRAVFENSAAGIAVTDLRGQFQAVNAAFQQMLGYTEDELRSLSFIDITYEEDRDENVSACSDLLSRKRQYFQVEKRYRRKDGGFIWVSVYVSLISTGAGTPRLAVAVAQDITERKRAEERRRQAEEALQNAQAELAHVTRLTTLGELSASIAHEVNQPLGAVVTDGHACLRWLYKAKPNLDEARAAVKRMIQEATHASEVIGRIRSLARKSPPRMIPLDMNQAIVDVLTLLRHPLFQNKVVLKTELVADLRQAQGDLVQLQQVMVNLFMNAIESMAMRIDGPRELIVASQNHGKDQIVIQVRDSGVGLDHGRTEQIFKPFVTSKSNGLGMGLSISRSIIEAHGGRLSAVPNDGPGATFLFSLRAAEDRRVK